MKDGERTAPWWETDVCMHAHLGGRISTLHPVRATRAGVCGCVAFGGLRLVQSSRKTFEIKPKKSQMEPPHVRDGTPRGIITVCFIQ